MIMPSLMCSKSGHFYRFQNGYGAILKRDDDGIGTFTVGYLSGVRPFEVAPLEEPLAVGPDEPCMPLLEAVQARPPLEPWKCHYIAPPRRELREWERNPESQWRTAGNATMRLAEARYESWIKRGPNY